MHGRVAGPVDEARRHTLESVHAAYDMNRHFTHGSPQSLVLDDDTIDAFAVAGPSSYCVERLQELLELGLSKLVLTGGGAGVDRDAMRTSRRAVVDDVLPALR